MRQAVAVLAEVLRVALQQAGVLGAAGAGEVRAGEATLVALWPWYLWEISGLGLGWERRVSPLIWARTLLVLRLLSVSTAPVSMVGGLVAGAEVVGALVDVALVVGEGPSRQCRLEA